MVASRDATLCLRIGTWIWSGEGIRIWCWGLVLGLLGWEEVVGGRVGGWGGGLGGEVWCGWGNVGRVLVGGVEIQVWGGSWVGGGDYYVGSGADE